MTQEDMIYSVLEDLSIPYECLEHDPIASVAEAAAKGVVLPGQQVKNLVLKNKKGRQYYLVILRDEKQADLKKMAEALGEKRLSFAKEEELEDLMKVVPGTVTPFGLLYDTEHRVQVVVDEEVDPSLTVGFHPFVNTRTLNIAYTDFERFLEWTGHSVRRVDC